MAGKVSFDKNVWILILVSFFLFASLMFLTGLYIGIGAERPECQPKQTETKSRGKTDQTDQTGGETVFESQRKITSQLATETEPKPVSPEFEEVSPVSEQPEIEPVKD